MLANQLWETALIRQIVSPFAVVKGAACVDGTHATSSNWLKRKASSLGIQRISKGDKASLKKLSLTRTEGEM